jgi:hypothetical protein
MLNFAGAPNYLDTRVEFTRNSIASYIDRQGTISYVPAHAPRWQFDPFSGECLGIVIETRRTNSFLHSEDFSNAAWTKTNCSVVVNSFVSPSGAATADSIITEAANGTVRQNITIVSTDQGFVFSVYAKPRTTNFALLRASDGTNTVTAWYNLITNTVETDTLSAGGSVILHYTQADPMPNGWVRCALAIRTTSASTYTLSFGATMSSRLSPAVADSLYLWGAQAEENIPHGVSSYIPTTVSTVTRQADNAIVPVNVATDKWFNLTKGSLYLEWDSLSRPDSNTAVVGGLGDTFANSIYAVKTPTKIDSVFNRSGSGGTLLFKTITLPVQTRTKAMLTWNSAGIATTINGTAPASSTVLRTPTSVLRFGIGTAPWDASAQGTGTFGIHRVFAYYPQRLSNDNMQTLTTL